MAGALRFYSYMEKELDMGNRQKCVLISMRTAFVSNQQAVSSFTLKEVVVLRQLIIEQTTSHLGLFVCYVVRAICSVFFIDTWWRGCLDN